MKKIDAYPQNIFDKICEENNWNDTNIELVTDKAFISIIGTKDVQEHYLHEGEVVHWFKENHPNVLNLEFDDIKQDVEWEDYKAYAITDEQAQAIIDFIEANKGKTILVHCRAGISRSGAVAYWCTQHIDEYKGIHLDHVRPNVTVLAKLNHILWQRHFNESNEDTKESK